jgi:SOS-response transcriptional repressor LexA
MSNHKKKYDYLFILNWIIDFVKENNYLPGIREIMAGCNISSTSMVRHILGSLEQMGKIRMGRKGSSRTYHIENSRWIYLPDIPIGKVLISDSNCQFWLWNEKDGTLKILDNEFKPQEGGYFAGSIQSAIGHLIADGYIEEKI